MNVKFNKHVKERIPIQGNEVNSKNYITVEFKLFTFLSDTCIRTSLVAQMVKHLPTMWETRIQSLGQEDLLEKEMAAHSSTLAWKIPWTEEPGGLQSMVSQRVGHD